MFVSVYCLNKCTIKIKNQVVLLIISTKWTKHINTIIERASKQLNILRKLKFKLNRQYLENIYITFIRPILEYGSEVWDNCGAVNSDRLEKVQTEVARIVTGLLDVCECLLFE
jgi:hypothetical protein